MCRLVISRVLAGVTVALTVALIGAPAHASSRPPSTKTPSLSEYCAARVEEPDGPQDKKGATKAARETLEALERAAPTPEQVSAVARIAKLFDRRGLEAFGSPKAQQSLRVIDGFTYANCGFTQMDVTAEGFAYGGVPASIASGTIALRLTNRSSDLPHEMVVYKFAPNADVSDPTALLSLSPKKAAEVLEFRQYARAEPGDFGVSIAPLAPGSYVAACLLPIDGERGAAPNYTKGMYARFEVTA